MCGQIEVEDSEDNGECYIVEKLSNGDIHVFAFDFYSDTILLGYPRYGEHTERLHRHHWKGEEFVFDGFLMICVVEKSLQFRSSGQNQPSITPSNKNSSLEKIILIVVED